MGTPQLGMLRTHAKSQEGTEFSTSFFACNEAMPRVGQPWRPEPLRTKRDGSEVNMTANRNDHREMSEQEQTNRNEQDIVIPAIRHIGRTLESDETTEGQELADAVTFLEDANSGTSIYEPRPDSVRVRDKNEPLRTRLPGDTSSEPHTDVGPDNAATVQHRGEDSET
jgi:hypothetical protein